MNEMITISDRYFGWRRRGGTHGDPVIRDNCTLGRAQNSDQKWHMNDEYKARGRHRALATDHNDHRNPCKVRCVTVIWPMTIWSARISASGAITLKWSSPSTLKN